MKLGYLLIKNIWIIYFIMRILKTWNEKLLLISKCKFFKLFLIFFRLCWKEILTILKNNSSLHLSLKFIKNYIDNISWEDKKSFTKRLLDITPLLLLARVDGKSPIEYFKVKQQKLTRQLGKHILKDEVKTLEQLYSILDNYVSKKNY